jgi:multiple sugar transport system permease protein
VLDAATLLLLLVVLFPFLWLVQMSFRPNDDIFGYDLLFTPTLEHYRALWTGIFPGSFVNSVVVSVSSTALSLLVGVPAAYALSRAQFRRKRAIALWILATRMAPPIAFTIPFFLAYRHAGLLDTQLGLIIVYLTFNLALVIWMMQTFFEGVPRALEEAAWIDGCGIWQTFRRVTLPLSAPGLAATSVLCFILSWNDFFYALVLTRTNASTAPVAIVNFIQYTGWEWGRIAAAATLVMLPVVVFSMLVRNYLVRGLTAGGTKE